jgi:hypothetical protein
MAVILLKALTVFLDFLHVPLDGSVAGDRVRKPRDANFLPLEACYSSHCRTGITRYSSVRWGKCAT